MKPPRRSSTSAAPASAMSSRTSASRAAAAGPQVTDLLVLVGRGGADGRSRRSRGMPGGVQISVAGGLSTGVGYTLDGATHNNPQRT